MNYKELEDLCFNIRQEILNVVSKNGGHLASNLGVVELTVALHKVFDCPKDKIVWDVGHQCYAHKILTDRADKMTTIRQKNGISGFTRRTESVYDAFSSGHSSTSISAAFGLLNANLINKKDDEKVVVVIGDGALSGGLAYEGINNAGSFKKNFIVILNDNEMSISKNVGSMAGYLSVIRTKNFYIKTKNILNKILKKTSIVGDLIKKIILKSTFTVKDLVYNNTIFENLGFVYYGPVDGHNIKALVDVLEVAKKKDRPVLIHVKTIKGKGYSYAENNPNLYHGISKFNINEGVVVNQSENFSSVFGKSLVKLAEKDKKICAITAAMQIGTGLTEFAKKFKDRFFDVGIAEEHAVTFAGGLSAGGLIPVFAVYSTFLQRSYDQIIHDVALQGFKVILAVDRAGIVGEDGETHQGVFDVSFFSAIPTVTAFSPCYFDEIMPTLKKLIYKIDGIGVIRYPRGKELYKPIDFMSNYDDFDIYGDTINCENLIITYGRLFSYACMTKENLSLKNIKVCIIKLNKIIPINKKILDIMENFKNIFFFEEGMQSGGIGEKFCYLLKEKNYQNYFKLTAINNCFVPQMTMESALHKLSLDADGMEKIILQKVMGYDK